MRIDQRVMTEEMKYLKWLNLIPLIMFFIVDKLRGTLISRYLLIIIVVLGVINMLISETSIKLIEVEDLD